MSIRLSSSLNFGSEKFLGPNGSYVEVQIVPLKRIHINDICAKEDEATAITLIRQVMQRAIQENLAVSATVPWKSNNHIFYLKMGMIPDDFPLSYAVCKYGQKAYLALAALKTSKPDAEQLEELEAILGKEEGRTEVAEREVFEKKAFLLGLVDKTISVVKDQFIPALLSFLGDPKAKLYGSRYLGSMNMQLSVKGRLRWQHAMEDEIPFTPFGKFEHLVPLMTAEQQKQLTESLKK